MLTSLELIKNRGDPLQLHDYCNDEVLFFSILRNLNDVNTENKTALPMVFRAFNFCNI